MEHLLILQLAGILGVGTLLVLLCQKYNLSPVLGYLATGVLVGPSGLDWLAQGDTTQLLAELGVVLLMFTIGLEFSLPRLLASKKLVLGLGGSQVLITALLFGAAAWLLDFSTTEAFVLGGALAMSSTAIVLKQLGEQMELSLPHGRVVTGVLLLQDIAAVPILVVLPVLVADPVELTGALAMALGKAILVFGALAFLGRRLLPRALQWIAATRSLELFMLTALLLVGAAAGLSAVAGLSPTLGAFMAGMLLGETIFRHQVEADIRPFRDIMLGLFFVTIGMQFDLSAFLVSPLAVLLVVLALGPGKILILVPLVRWYGYTRDEAVRSALCLGQGGEFGLLVVSSALGLGLLNVTAAQPVLGGLILSMVLAPLLIRHNAAIAARFDGLPEKSRVSEELHSESEPLEQLGGPFQGHVIICGFGRVGQNLLQILKQENIPGLALDLDVDRVTQAAQADATVLFGNAAQPAVLEAAGLSHAAAVAITIDDASLAERIVLQIRALGQTLPILVRSAQGASEHTLMEAGAHIFPEGFEASLAYAGQLLILLDVPTAEVEARLNSIRADDYASLRALPRATQARDGDASIQTSALEREAIVLDDFNQAVGRTPQELDLPRYGVELEAVGRGAIRLPGYRSDVRLRAGDVLLLRGTREALENVSDELIRRDTQD